jgi:hypothetical protein
LQLWLNDFEGFSALFVALALVLALYDLTNNRVVNIFNVIR